MLKKIAVAATLATAAVPAFVHPAMADCPEGRMLYMKGTVEGPDIPAGSFATQPKVTYRLGDEYLRIEEVPDPAMGLHLLLVVNKGNVWMTNLADHTGSHSVTSEPPFTVHSAIMCDVDSPHWAPLEFGRELAFMKSVSARKVISPDGTSMYTHTAEGITARLYTSKSGVPTKIALERPDRSFTIHYLEYECRKPDLSLFQRPAGIAYSEEQ